MGTHLPSRASIKMAENCGGLCPLFGPGALLTPNGWMHQHATWYGDRPQPRRLCVRWGPSFPSPKWTQSPNFRPMSVVAKRLDELRWHLVYFVFDGDPASSPKRGLRPHPQFSANLCCAQTAGYITMALGMEVGLSPGDFVFDGDPAPPQKGGGAPNFRPMSIVAKWLDASRWHSAWRWALVQATMC